MTLCNAEGRCIFSGKDVTHRSSVINKLRDENNSNINHEINIEFMESIGAIGFGSAGVKSKVEKLVLDDNIEVDRTKMFAQQW